MICKGIKLEVAAGLEPAKTGFADQRLGLFGIATQKQKTHRPGFLAMGSSLHSLNVCCPSSLPHQNTLGHNSYGLHP